MPGTSTTVSPEPAIESEGSYPSDIEFSGGGLADRVDGLQIAGLDVSDIVHFPILVSRSQHIRIREMRVSESGNLNAKGRNNLSGGILIEEGSSDFEVTASTFTGITGNGLWTHSLFTSPRLDGGLFARNKFETIGRDANA